VPPALSAYVPRGPIPTLGSSSPCSSGLPLLLRRVLLPRRALNINNSLCCPTVAGAEEGRGRRRAARRIALTCSEMPGIPPDIEMTFKRCVDQLHQRRCQLSTGFGHSLRPVRRGAALVFIPVSLRRPISEAGRPLSFRVKTAREYAPKMIAEEVAVRIMVRPGRRVVPSDMRFRNWHQDRSRPRGQAVAQKPGQAPYVDRSA
jgi:hypothetical protein